VWFVGSNSCCFLGERGGILGLRCRESDEPPAVKTQNCDRLVLRLGCGGKGAENCIDTMGRSGETVTSAFFLVQGEGIVDCAFGKSWPVS
jgi:hypothetical protein